MVYHIELQLQGYALAREGAIRGALERILPGISNSWLTYTLHGGGTASASLTPRVEVDDPRALAASLTTAVVTADPSAKAFVSAIETTEQRLLRVG
jgi:hypothetical protein